MRINFIVFALAILLLTSSVVTVTFSQKVFADSQNTKSDHVKDKDKKPLPETDFGADRKQIKSKMGLQPNEERVIIIYKDNVKKTDKDNLEKKGGKIKTLLDKIHGVAVQIDQAKLEEIKSDPNVAQVIEDTIMYASLSTSVPQIGANLVQSSGITGKNAKVCIVDTGVDDTHPALNHLVAEFDFVNNDNDATDDNGHGTHVAGIIASHDTTYKGVAPDASLMAAKVLASNGMGFTSNVITAINWCVTNGADVINLSLGGSTLYTSTCDLNSNGTINLEAQAVNNAVNQGVVVAAASGNNGVDNGIVSPACASKAIAVGAIDQLDHRTAFSNEGTNLAVVAPGVAITSLRSPSNGGGFIALSGTSMATPHVVGLTALLLEKNPNLTPQQVRTTIQNTALDLGTPGFDTIYGNGRIRANNAILATIPSSVSVSSSTGIGSVQFSTNNGGISSISAVSESTLPIAGKPTMSFPFGFFDYTVTGITPSLSAVIAIKYPSNIPTGTQFWKVSGGTWTNISSLVSSNDGDQNILLTIQDGALGDSDGVANGQIIDPIGGGNPTLSINDVSISEGNSGITNAQLTVSLSAPSSQTISVSFATSDGTAISGSDYITTIGTITFAPSETIKTVIVPVNGDLNIESDETFFVDLSNPTDILITDSHGIVTIINDDSNIMPITFCGKTIDQFAAVIDGTVNNDVLKGTLGDDLIQGFTGNDRIFGMSGNNCIIGGLGNDYLVGGAGDDTIQENDDNDKIWGQAGIDTLFGGTGIDRIVGGTGNDFLYGESENDFLWGQTGDDILDGGTEIDICLGGLDSNTLTNCE